MDQEGLPKCLLQYIMRTFKGLSFLHDGKNSHSSDSIWQLLFRSNTVPFFLYLKYLLANSVQQSSCTQMKYISLTQSINRYLWDHKHIQDKKISTNCIRIYIQVVWLWWFSWLKLFSRFYLAYFFFILPW